VLRSPPVYQKLTGPLYPILHTITHRISPFLSPIVPARQKASVLPLVVMISGPAGWWTGIQAMLQHRTQLVWFRWLYLGFSKLMWINELVVMG